MRGTCRVVNEPPPAGLPLIGSSHSFSVDIGRVNAYRGSHRPISIAMTSDQTRRDFLKATAVAGAALTLGDLTLGSAFAAEPNAAGTLTTARHDMIPAAPSWIDKPMRWAQLTLVEDDPGTFDPQFWLDYFKRTKSDAVCLSAGGCVAYYPTTIPLHHRSAWLGASDPFGDLVAGCRKLGMV